MDAEEVQFVDPEVSKRKFKEELGKFEKAKQHYRDLGVVLIEQAYPDAHFAFVATSLWPPPIVFAVKINFINYDVWPLSVKFVHPITLAPLKGSQMLTPFPRRLEGSPQPQFLLQAQIDDIPFLCIPGIREYHQHTLHTGDSWFLYRKNGGEGSLCFILDNIQLYGTSHILAYTEQLVVNFHRGAMRIISDQNKIPV